MSAHLYMDSLWQEIQEPVGSGYLEMVERRNWGLKWKGGFQVSIVYALALLDFLKTVCTYYLKSQTWKSCYQDN